MDVQGIFYRLIAAIGLAVVLNVTVWVLGDLLVRAVGTQWPVFILGILATSAVAYILDAVTSQRPPA